MAAAYKHADNRHYSYEIDLANRIDRYGVHATMGRPVLYDKEQKLLALAENIVYAYRDRQASQNWGAWAIENPNLSRLLNEAMLLAESL